jgi:small subunit ribosomal protein S19|tara:strand:- start:619 stop:1002 length:384 start_codon:yes stop_codon:yes gene_type:complete
MAKKEFVFRGKTQDEVMAMSLQDFMELIPSRQRRSLKRGQSDEHKTLLKKIKAKKRNIETHCKDMVVIPEMIGATIKIHTGKEFAPVELTFEMLGHYIGEFVSTRSRVAHSAPGVGATKSSAALSVK